MQIAHKFGGTSMADAGCIARVADLLLARPEAGQSIVVSAMRGVTDALTELAHSASRRSTNWEAQLETLRKRHLVAAAALVPSDSDTADWLAAQFDELSGLLHALSVLGISGRETIERIQGTFTAFA